MNNKDLDLLNGPILKKLLIYIFPLICSNLLQVLYNAADIIVVGYSNVEGAIGSIGTTSAMINAIVNLFIGLSTGTSVIVARHIGENRPDSISDAVHTSILISLVCGLACSVIGMSFCRLFLVLIGDEGHILEMATKYARIYFAGVPFLSVTNFLIAVFRAKGDTSTALKVLSFTGLLNIALNLLFVLGFKMDVDGVATATIIANFVSCLSLLLILSKDKGLCRFYPSKLKINKEELKLIVKNGLPAGLQCCIFSLSNMLIQSSIVSVNSMLCPGGSAVIDGNTAGSSIEGFIYTATNSVATAETTFVSQHYGAKKFKRMDEVIRKSYLLTFVIAVVFTSIILGFSKTLLGLYVKDSLAVEIGIIKFKVMITPYFLLAFMEMGSSTLKGMNKPLTSTIVSLIGSCLIRIIWLATVFKKFQTVESVYISYPVTWFLTAVTHLIFIRKTRKELDTFKQQ